MATYTGGEELGMQRPNRRLTTGNRSGGDCAPPSGFQSARSWACAHSHASFHPHFASPSLAAQALIQAGKTSVT